MVVRHRHRSSAFTLSHEEEVGNPTNAENANDSPKRGGAPSIEYSEGCSGELDWTQLHMRRLPACASGEAQQAASNV